MNIIMAVKTKTLSHFARPKNFCSDFLGKNCLLVASYLIQCSDENLLGTQNPHELFCHLISTRSAIRIHSLGLHIANCLSLSVPGIVSQCSANVLAFNTSKSKKSVLWAERLYSSPKMTDNAIIIFFIVFCVFLLNLLWETRLWTLWSVGLFLFLWKNNSDFEVKVKHILKLIIYLHFNKK